MTYAGTRSSMIRLIGLNSLFSKQLPKVPRAYVARLLLDRSPHVPGGSIVVDAIIGGICYRTFWEQLFEEIAFCAVHATHHDKGYGTKLMNLLKQTAPGRVAST